MMDPTPSGDGTLMIILLSNVSAILLRGQHGDPKREPQGEYFGPTNFFRDCSNRLLDSRAPCPKWTQAFPSVRVRLG